MKVQDFRVRELINGEWVAEVLKGFQWEGIDAVSMRGFTWAKGSSYYPDCVHPDKEAAENFLTKCMARTYGL